MAIGAGAAGGDELAVGVAIRPAAQLLGSLRAELDRLDPGQLPARDALELVEVLDRIGRVADAGKMAAALRVAESSLWSRKGHRSPAHMLAALTGVGVGDAVRLLKTGEAVAAAPETEEALRRGEVSPQQAAAVAEVEKLSPDKGRELLAKAPDVSLPELRDEANRIVAAESTETDAEKSERHRKARRVIDHGIGADGMGSGTWRLPPAQHVRLVAQLTAEKERIFRDRRANGGHEAPEAYLADALIHLGNRAARADTTDGPGSADGVDGVEDWGFAKVIVRVDAEALARGEVGPGERCEIAGQGPVPVRDAWRAIAGGAFVAAISTRGVEIDKVVHLGRRVTALQRTAHEWLTAAKCSTEGCTSKARLEIDHVADWADTHRTELSQIAGPCGWCHDLKTRHGYRFGPRQPNGKRRLIPPDEEGTDVMDDTDDRAGPAPPGITAAPDTTECADGADTGPDGARTTDGATRSEAGPAADAGEPIPITDAPSVAERAQSLAERARARRAHPSSSGRGRRRPSGGQGGLFDTA